MQSKVEELFLQRIMDELKGLTMLDLRNYISQENKDGDMYLKMNFKVSYECSLKDLIGQVNMNKIMGKYED